MAASVSLTIRKLTVTNKLLHLKNYFVDVSTVLLHKIYYNITPQIQILQSKYHIFVT